MHEEHNRQSHGNARYETSFLRSRSFLVLLGFLAIAIVMLWQEHQAHILGAGLILLLLACPVMHFFMHGGHGGHSGHSDQKNNENTDIQRSDSEGDRP